jgi:phenol 2-monooxygenase
MDSAADSKVFLAGDAAHTSSPLSYGMNHSIHDAWNLAWKLNLAVRGLSKPGLLASYEDERKQVAADALDSDHEYLNSVTSGDPTVIGDNSLRNARFASGYGTDYAPNIINVPQKGSLILGQLRVGSIPPPTKVTRFFDSCPVDLQLDIPMLGQFRIFFFTKNASQSFDFLEAVTLHALTGKSVLARANSAANKSYSSQPPTAAVSDDFVRPERYTVIGGLCTFGLVLQMAVEDVVLLDLPPLWRESRFTVYLDVVPSLDTIGMACTEKWLGGCSRSEVSMVVLRPDGVVGTIFRGLGTKEHAARACAHLDLYFGGFLNV